MRRTVTRKRNLIVAGALLFSLSSLVWGQRISPTDEATQKTQSELRKKRNSRFDDRSKFLPKLDELKPGEGFGRSGRHPVSTAPIPAKSADAIILGAVNAFHSFFSNDHTAIYTEFRVVAENVLKGTPEEFYDAIIFGGAIRKADGRIIELDSDSPEMLQLNKRYVLFMRYDADMHAYRPFKVWKIKSGHPHPIDPEENADAEARRSDIVKMSEAEFLAAIREAINAR